jgi:hypothetical protein
MILVLQYIEVSVHYHANLGCASRMRQVEDRVNAAIWPVQGGVMESRGMNASLVNANC